MAMHPLTLHNEHPAGSQEPQSVDPAVRASGQGVLIAQLLVIVLAWAFVATLQWHNDGLWFQGDSPRHAANGLFWKDFLLSGSFSPLEYALRYYARYPVINPTSYPPVFYLLEGALFGILHPSPYLSKALVLLFALAAALYVMAWVRRWIGPESGWAAALLLLSPGFVRWSNAVMLNVPATALSLAALYHARRWIEAPAPPSPRHMYLCAALAGLATLTYFPAAVVILIIAAWVLLFGRVRRLLNPEVARVVFVFAALLLPWCYLAYKWAPTHTRFVLNFIRTMGPHSIAASAGSLPEIAGFPLIALGVAGLIAALAGRSRRRETGWLISLFVLEFVTISELIWRSPRFGLLLCAPIVCLSAIAARAFASWFGRRAGRRAGGAASVLAAAAVIGLQGWLAARTTVPRVEGVREAAVFMARAAPHEAVFYDGYYSSIFTFYIQAGDPGYERRVVLGSKLLYASAIQPRTHYRAFVGSEKDVVETLEKSGGSRWIALEIGANAEQVPAASLLRKAVLGPAFERVRSFPVRAPGLDRIDLYRLKADPAPVEEVDLPFPILGGETRFRVRPITR